MIPRGSWIRTFERLIGRLPNDGTVALVGVGSRDNGDDAMGPMVIDVLRKGLGKTETRYMAEGKVKTEVETKVETKAETKAETVIPRLVLFDGGAYPEALSGELKMIKPSAVVFVDAVATPDKSRCFMAPLSEIEVGGGGGFTHRMSLGMYAGYLAAETGADVWLLGIPLPRHADSQESATAFGGSLSKAAKTKSRRVARELLTIDIL